MKFIKKKIRSLGSYRYVLYIWFFAIAYYAFYASDRYVPEAQVYVKASKSMTSLEGIPSLSLMAMGVSQASPDLLLLKNYMHSKDMLDKADAALNLRQHYEEGSVDFLSRLKPWASDEDFLDYYRDHLVLDVDAESGLMFVQAEAFDREYAVKLTQFLLKEGEAYINKVGQDIAKEEIKFVQKEVDQAASKLQVVKEDLLRFQSENNTLSPEEESMAFLKVISGLRAELVQAKAELKGLQSFLTDSAPEIASLHAKINAIEEQIKQEESSVTSAGHQSLGGQNALFQALKLRLEFATEVYTTTLAVMEQTRVEVTRQLKHLVVVQKPALPDSARYPRSIYNLLTLFVVLSMIYGIGIMIVATVKEHRNV